MRSAKALAFLFVCVAFTTLVSAQTGTSSVRGIVSDAKGAVLPDATVTVTDPQNGFSRTAKTDGRGEYQLLQLPPSTYAVTVIGKGFAPLKQDGVQLLVGVPSTLNFTLQVQGQAVTVEVTGQGVQVNTTDATMGNAFNSNQIEELPFEGRNPVEMLSLQAGVTYTNPTSGTAVNNMVDTRSGAVNGGRSDQANITLDGVDNNDQENAFAFTGAVRSTLDSVEEFRVTTTNSNADAGRSSGAQVQLVTKSGTNGWHGSAYEFNRSNIGEANDWFNENQEDTTGQRNIPPFLRRNTFGASFGGPIKKDRLFFFTNWERQVQHESTETTRIVPSMNLRAGTASYFCVTGSDPNCVVGNLGNNGASITVANAPGVTPGDLLVTMSPGTLSLLDPNCSGEGICPQGPGANPTTEGILQGYPAPNEPFAIGGDGFNYQGFGFPGPTPLTLNTYIAKLDYNITQNGNHRIFVRGIMNGDRDDQAPQFPGMIPNIAQVTVAKSLAVGYTAVLTNNLINNFHYGLTRQAVDQVGAGNVSFVTLRGLDNPGGQFNDSYLVAVPVHNFIDDLTWIRGKHTLEFGGNLRLLGNIKSSYLSSFSGAVTNASWLNVSGIANKGTSLDPSAPQFGSGTGGANYELPLVDPGFNNSWDYPVMALAGIISQVNAQYNFTTSGATLPNGAPNNRHFVNREFETYVQDSWRARPNLTITYGLRWTLLQPPYEKNGVEVAPTFSLNGWFKQRAATMLAGQAFDDPITFALAGNANNKPSYWGYDYKDFAPRFAIAYSPDSSDGWLGRLMGGPGKTSIRLGAGMYYDHFGQGVVNTFDQNGSFGLSTSLANVGGVQSVDGVAATLTPGGQPAPRMGTVNPLYTLPPSLITPSPGANFPVTYPLTNFAVQWGLDDKLKTPYSYAFNLSFERELRHNFTLEVAYVGRLGHRLLQQEDLAQPRDIVDPASHTDYYAATRLLDNAVQGSAPETALAPIPYWENLFGATSAGPGGAAGCRPANEVLPTNPTATQNMMDLMSCGFVHNETTFQQIIDGVGGVPCFPGCITLGGVTATTPQYFSSQYASLFSWRSIGSSYYDAGQLILRHTMSHGVQFDLNYTYAHSIDMGSDAERIAAEGGLGDQIYNAWNPSLQRATSTFDTKHQLNSNWVLQVPYGKGRPFGDASGRIVNGVFGGWDLTGVLRLTSGFPVSVANGAAWATNWELGGYATQIGPTPSTGVTIANGQPNMFTNYTTAINSYRQDYPGEVGGRNTLRGPGYFDTDLGLHKVFNVTERQQLQFRWDVYNAFNSVRFDVQSANIEPDIASSFGFFTRTLTLYRRMEFGVRYQF